MIAVLMLLAIVYWVDYQKKKKIKMFLGLNARLRSVLIAGQKDTSSVIHLVINVSLDHANHLV